MYAAVGQLQVISREEFGNILKQKLATAVIPAINKASASEAA
jgi:hypothetical protein